MSEADTDSDRLCASLATHAAKLQLDPADAIPSVTLMNGRREVVILHAGERYRLRVTANDRLILTK